MKEVKAENLQPGMVVRREWWLNFREVMVIDKAKNLIEFTDGYRASLAGNFFVKEPNQIKIGDAITVVPHPDGNYVVAQVLPDGVTVILQHANGLLAHGTYRLPDFPQWSINGVTVPEFFNDVAEDAQPTPKKPRRIYNAE